MLFNYLTIAFRNLWRNKLYSFINVLGLAVGLASAIIVLVYSIDEFSYDQYHEKKDRIFRLSYQEQRQDDLLRDARVPFPYKNVLIGQLPEVEKAARMMNNVAVGGPDEMEVGSETYAETNLFVTDPELFSILDFDWIAGDAGSAFKELNSVVLTRSIAIKYFGTTGCLGETIVYNKGPHLVVTGVVDDLPRNTHMTAEIFVPMALLDARWTENYQYDVDQDWKWLGSYTYILLKDNAQIATVYAKMPGLVEQYFQEVDPATFTPVFLPLTDIHLRSGFRSEMKPGSSMTQLYLFMIIAGVILLVAVINFMNLATARSAKRAKEAGIRKVMGAYRRQVVTQFLSEAVVIAGLGLVHALVLVNLALPVFNTFTDRSYQFSDFTSNPLVMGAALAITVLTGIASGIYPAFYISAFTPVQAMKKDFNPGKSHLLRSALVTLQFAVSTVFIVGVLVVNTQLNYLRGKELGFAKERTILINNRSLSPSQYQLFRQTLASKPEVSDVYMGTIPGMGVWGNTVVPEGFDENQGVNVSMMYGTANFADFFGVGIEQGRGFLDEVDQVEDGTRQSFLINKTLAKKLGWESAAVGREIHWLGGSDNKTLQKGLVVGVIDDFHYNSLHRPIGSLLVVMANWGGIAVKLSGDSYGSGLSEVQAAWNDMFPDKPFQYSYLDQDIAEQYLKEEQLGKLISWFTLLAVFICCMGLYGLVAFVVEQRRKEFAIRKTLGATVRHIVALISTHMLKTVLFASVVAIPISVYLLSNWLDTFPYRIQLSPLFFVLAALISVIVMLATMASNAYRAATRNPVDSLRSE
ncbi:MAG: ABC transporter permease [Imperialibacter sp.]|uniref:ABC transporter permease n=1 Tax=Imperialibacter sp. TaxID=2038411 RepID=UPI003A84ED31